MPTWAIAGIPYFLYVSSVAVMLPGLTAQGRRRALAWSVFGFAVILAGTFAPWGWLRVVLLPPVALLAAYWSSGALWTGPMERAERVLVRWDERFRIRQTAAVVPRPLVEFLEGSYAAVYPVIPLALAAHVAVSPTPDADRFWTVILVTDFVCFGMLPWIRTRPPRALDPRPPWRSTFRALNVRLLGETSIGFNTVPSGHAAEALAAALMLTTAPSQIAVPMWVMALSISAGAVYGRYHFALDALAGWAVALVVWAVLW